MAITLRGVKGSPLTWAELDANFAAATPTSCGTLINYTTTLGNTSVGCFAGSTTTTGTDNISIGCCAGFNITTGGANISIGTMANRALTTGLHNIAIGYCALFSNCSGRGAVAIGYRALGSNCQATNSVAIGYQALANDNSMYNTAVGNNSQVGLAGQAGGCYNTSVGESSLFCITTGCCNTAVGWYAMGLSPGGHGNVAVGYCAMISACNSCYNTVVGICAGANLGVNASCSVAIGHAALNLLSVTGGGSIAIGYGALRGQTNGPNVAIGSCAMGVTGGVLLGACNTIVGYIAGCAMTCASCNTGLGYGALYTNSTGCSNTAVGYRALCAGSSNFNTGVGANTLISLGQQNSCNTALGYNAGCTAISGTNNSFLGYGAIGATNTSANAITIGAPTTNCIRSCAITITTLSDCRDKTNISGIPIGLQFIKEVRPVQFTWNSRDGCKVGIDEMGFIAQELNALQNKYGVEDSLKLVLLDNPDKLEAAPGKLFPVVIRAIQELSIELDKSAARIAALVLKHGYHTTNS